MANTTGDQLMALEIRCPFCGGKCNIRTSERPTLLTVQAKIYCQNCGTLQADFVGQLTNVKRALFIDCNEAERWSKTEKEQIQEDGKRPLTNDERIAQFRAGKEQPDLFHSEETIPKH
ncbi:transcriptional regulator [Ursidibacter sp. B-7004-1]